MKFWDASGLVALLVVQAATPRMKELIETDPGIYAWWGTRVECASALARIQRSEPHLLDAGSLAFNRLGEFASTWQEVEASELVRNTALRFLRVHPLRAADALQLAASFVAAERNPTTLEFVTLDERLAVAARKEGFVVITA